MTFPLPFSRNDRSNSRSNSRPNPRSNSGRVASSVLLALVLAFTALAQEGKPLTKPEERAKFHPTIVKGMSATERATAYEKRLALEKESFFNGIKWRNVGPEVQSGRVISILSPKKQPRTTIIGYATGGLYKTEDDGQTWTSLFDRQSSFGIGRVAVSDDGQTIWVGTGESNSQRTSYAGTGVFKSTDGGKTWVNVGLPESHHIGNVVIDPKNPHTVWVAVLGHLYSQNEERGVYKTTNGGKSWELVLKVDEFTGAVDIVIDPRNPNTVLAAMWDRDRRAWNFRESGKGSGVFRSTNGGKSWVAVDTLPKGDAAGRTGLAQSPSRPDIVYAYVNNNSEDKDWFDEDERVPAGRMTPRRFLLLDEAMFVELDQKALDAFWKASGPEGLKLEDAVAQVKDKKLTLLDIRQKMEKRNPNIFEPGLIDEEVFRSEDGGKTFKRVAKLGTHGGYYWGKIFVNPRNPDDVWVTGVSMLRSMDGGKSWEVTGRGTHADHHMVHFDHLDPNKIWIGNDGGAYVTQNNGKNFRAVNNVSVGQTTTLGVVQEAAPYTIYTGLQDNGTMQGKSNYVPGRSSLDAWTDIGGGDGSAIAIDPRTELGMIYIASQFGAHSAIDQKNNQRWGAAPRAAKGEVPLRFNWISPFIVSSHMPEIVYVGSQKLHRSFNRGRTWQAISGDLTRNLPNGDVPHSSLKDISESPLRFGLIYCGSDDGRMTMTPDGGYQWMDIDTPTPKKWISRVVASRHAVETVYVSQSGYREDDFSAYLWKSDDYGKTWKSIVGNLPAETINVIREDAKNKDILYVGTDHGVWISFNRGETWEALQGGLGHLPVHDLILQEKENELVIATHAQGVFILPLAKVHSLTAKMRETDITILDLDNLTKMSSWGFDPKAPWDKTPVRVPKTDLNFFLKDAGSATVQVLDKDKKVAKEFKVDAIRGYNTLAIDILVKAGDVNAPALPKPTKASEVTADRFAARRPVFLAPGTYTVTITVNGKSLSKEWKITE